MMTSITVDDATASLFRWVKQPVRILDEEGRWIGTFEPLDQKSLYRDVEIPFSEEELRRSEPQEGGRSHAEILADLENRPRD